MQHSAPQVPTHDFGLDLLPKNTRWLQEKINSKVFIVGTPSDQLGRSLSREFWVQTCPAPAEALRLLPATECVAIVCCVENEREAGDFLDRAAALRPDVPIAVMVRESWSEMVSALPDRTSVLLLDARGNPELVRINLRHFVLEHARREEQTGVFEQSVNATVAALFEVLSIVDPYSASLGQRLRYAVELFCKSGKVALTWELETGALLAEIGVLTVPVRVIMKHQTGQELSPFEKGMISHVPERGADLLQQIPSFSQVARVLRYQGKNFDGTGLPSDSLAGEKLPLGARILKVLNDLFRLRENGNSQDEAIQEMENRAGRYDPELLRIAKECFNVNLPSKIAASTLPLGVKDLRPGQLLVSNIETDDGVLLIRDGQVISPRLLHKLRNFAFTSGIKEPIYVIDLLESRQMATTFQGLVNPETSFFLKPK